MKLVLYGSWGNTYVPVLAVARYLRTYKKGTRFYIYAYDIEKKLYRREPLHNYEKRTDTRFRFEGEWYDFISLTDLGQEYRPDVNQFFEDIPELYRFREINNPDFIPILQSIPENFFHLLTVHDIPKGKRYRILEYDGSPYIEYEEDAEWEIAT